MKSKTCLKQLDIAARTQRVVTLEDNVISGGLGEKLCSLVLLKRLNIKVENIGWPDKFIEHGNTEDLFKKYKLDKYGITERISEFIEK